MPAKKYTKADIVDALYEKTGMNRKEIRTIMDLFINEIRDALMRCQVIELRGFGTFEVKVRKSRPRARNPKTGEKISVVPKRLTFFRAGKELKEFINQ